MSFKILPLVVILSALGACSKPVQTTSAQQNGEFAGCYTIDKAKPAQIKINQDGDKYTMQMKEPVGAKTIWDNPEPLELMTINDAWQFFGVNMLDLDKSDLHAVIARPDKMMVLAQVKQVSQNTNPRLDSPYVVYIFRGANTIYQVACDDVPLNIIHH